MEIAVDGELPTPRFWWNDLSHIWQRTGITNRRCGEYRGVGRREPIMLGPAGNERLRPRTRQCQEESERREQYERTYLCDDGSISLDKSIVPEEGEVRGRLPIALKRSREKLSFRQKLRFKRLIHEIILSNALRDKRSGFRTLGIEKTFKTRISYLFKNRNSFKAFRDS